MRLAIETELINELTSRRLVVEPSALKLLSELKPARARLYISLCESILPRITQNGFIISKEVLVEVAIRLLAVSKLALNESVEELNKMFEVD